MAGDDDKKLKKKKTTKKDAAPPEPEPEPVPEPVAEPEPVPEAPPPAKEAPPPEVEEGPPPAVEEEITQVTEDGVLAEPPPAPKKKPKFFIHWNRKKPRFYDYNFDYGENYYAPVVSYIDHKNLGSNNEIPRRKAFAERGIDSSLIRKNQPDLKTQNILHNIRSSISAYENFQRYYAHDMNRKYM